MSAGKKGMSYSVVNLRTYSKTELKHFLSDVIRDLKVEERELREVVSIVSFLKKYKHTYIKSAIQVFDDNKKSPIVLNYVPVSVAILLYSETLSNSKEFIATLKKRVGNLKKVISTK